MFKPGDLVRFREDCKFRPMCDGACLFMVRRLSGYAVVVEACCSEDSSHVPEPHNWYAADSELELVWRPE